MDQVNETRHQIDALEAHWHPREVELVTPGIIGVEENFILPPEPNIINEGQSRLLAIGGNILFVCFFKCHVILPAIGVDLCRRLISEVDKHDGGGDRDAPDKLENEIAAPVNQKLLKMHPDDFVTRLLLVHLICIILVKFLFVDDSDALLVLGAVNVRFFDLVPRVVMLLLIVRVLVAWVDLRVVVLLLHI